MLDKYTGEHNMTTMTHKKHAFSKKIDAISAAQAFKGINQVKELEIGKVQKI